MKRGLLWDSSAILALLNSDDGNHARAAEIVRRIAAEGRASFITNHIEVETHGLLLGRLGRIAARQWLLARALPVVRAAPSEEQRAQEIVARYADKDWSLCDAISFAVMEGRGLRTAFSFDHHFQQYGRFEILGP